jgi:hypothetical protein
MSKFQACQEFLQCVKKWKRPEDNDKKCCKIKQINDSRFAEEKFFTI